MKRIYLLMLVFFLSGCVTALVNMPTPASFLGKNISVTLGYDGPVKASDEVAMILETNELKIFSINGKNTLAVNVSSFRTLWNRNLSPNYAIHTHLLPGNYELTVKYTDGKNVGSIVYPITVKAGDVISFSPKVQTENILGKKTFSLITVDRLADRSQAVTDFEVVKNN